MSLITLELEPHDYERLTEMFEFATAQAIKTGAKKEYSDFSNLYKKVKLYELSRNRFSKLSNIPA